ncbi:MAG: DNA repair protein RadA [Betaproteobacteria bacterium]|jgi:DNA repair protein RadA/Sms|nr:DNA repair protein RadA [Betaproteobacteria bacterium]NBS92526.1 DNA repair protein RadA [Betaproteobacteria bacterium]NBU11995.1 DNA repair protein RadA [Betaproteobacteria bacterium]NCA23375.1 DNA repair protein RadA [Betaproteobacteria bacterium]NDF70105.1 DNA repair protein RadA [Betaproteobacteria bacterium]
MARSKTTHVCTECGATSPKWQGQCPGCSGWNTLVETVAEASPSRFVPLAADTAQVVTLASVEAREEARTPTGIDELDRVLGGGIVRGGVVLLGGDPGIGKSTLLMQAGARIAALAPVLYVSGEESAQQIALRAQRLQVDAERLHLLTEIRLEAILARLQERKPALAIIDSIQTVYSDALTSAPGSVAQVRECAAQLTRYAKQSGTAIVLVGHVTKEGALAGPRVLEHIVDTVLYFEGDTHSSYRLVRAIKNRFGAANELGVFGMTERGLKPIGNPSALFLAQHAKPVAGTSVLATLEGTRPLLIELQALVDTSYAPSPRRLSVGLEHNRLALLLAVLHRHGGIATSDQEVYINAVGGMRISEPAADLPVLLAIVSSLKNRPLPAGLIAFGEVGLAGEVRPVQRGQDRLREAAKLGFSRAILPKANVAKPAVPGITAIGVERLDEALERVWSD